jgi:hypothetical protein
MSAGHTFEYKWKTKQKMQFMKHKEDSRNRMPKAQAKAHPKANSGLGTDVDRVQPT